MSASKGPLLKVSTEEDIPVSATKTWTTLQKEGGDSSKIREELPYWSLCLNAAIKKTNYEWHDSMIL